MALAKDDIHALMAKAFPGAEITLQDVVGDRDHYSLTIVSPRFAGMPRVRQHQLVYQALEGRMGSQLHALAITTIAAKPKGAAP